MNKKYFISFLSVGILLTCGGFTTYKAVEKHPVTYDLDGGFITSDFVRSVRWIDEAKTPTAEKEHYVFKGWTDGNDTVTTIKHARNALNLKAVYLPEIYDVSFMDGDTEISKTMYAYGIGVSDLGLFAKGNAKNHPYEDFECWKDSDGNKVNSITETDFGDKVLTASYKGKSYKITYDLYDGSADGLPETYTYGTGVDSLPEASKDGKIFDGWFSDEECTQQVTSISKDTHGDIHLYAQYHNAPVATTTRSSSGSYRSSGSGSYFSSAASSSSSASYDLSYGAHIPSIGYNVSSAILDGGQAAINAVDCGMYENYTYHRNDYYVLEDGSTISGNDFRALSVDVRQSMHYVDYVNPAFTVTVYYDHASQGLSQLPYRISAGTQFYLNGVSYTYSGEWGTGSSTAGWDRNTNHDLVIVTCQPSAGNYYLYFNRN